MQIAHITKHKDFVKGLEAIAHATMHLALNDSVLQELEATAVILADDNSIIEDNIPVNIEVTHTFVGDDSGSNSDYAYILFKANISDYITGLDTTSNYQVNFDITYKEDSVEVNTINRYYGFGILEDNRNIESIFSDNENITAELLNRKMATIMAPGVLHGMQVVHGTGLNMLNVKPGAAASRFGVKYEVETENYNVVRLPELPQNYSRIDIIAIEEDGNKIPRFICHEGDENAGTPDYIEDTATAIAYVYSSPTMSSMAEAVIIPRLSIESKRPYARILNEDLSSQMDGVTKAFMLTHGVLGGEYALYLDKKRVSPAKTFVSGPKQITFVDSEPAPNGTSLLADYSVSQPGLLSEDQIKSYSHKDIIVTPSTPWADAQLLIRNAPITTSIAAPDIVTDWTNSGSLNTDGNLTFAKYSPTLSPDAKLIGNAVRLPYNANILELVASMANHGVNPHSLVLKASVAVADSEALLGSNSISNGPLMNFGIKINNTNPANPRWVVSHCGETETGTDQVAFNTPNVFTFTLSPSNNLKIKINNTEMFNGPASDVGSLASFSELYLKNSLGPTIYWLGYWGRELSELEISNLTTGLLNGNII